MSTSFPDPFYRWRPHPWHGLETGPAPPAVIHAYIEITPFDLVKYEIDKTTGYLHVDRPQHTSSQPPTLYGIIPRTYCGNRVCALSPGAKRGDGDPLDVCVFSERHINRAEVILRAKAVGVIQMIDNDEADDKIIAVLQNDRVWGGAEDVADLPAPLLERLQHYFITYKMSRQSNDRVSVENVLGHEHAHAVIRASMQDYTDTFGV